MHIEIIIRRIKIVQCDNARLIDRRGRSVLAALVLGAADRMTAGVIRSTQGGALGRRPGTH